MYDLQKARDYFSLDRFATENGAVIEEVQPEYAVCSMLIEARHRNALGNVMGGAVFTLADFAFAVASNFEQAPTVSTTAQITYLKAAKGDRLQAKCECIRRGRTTVYYETTVTDGFGNLVARVTSSGQVLPDA